MKNPLVVSAIIFILLLAASGGYVPQSYKDKCHSAGGEVYDHVKECVIKIDLTEKNDRNKNN